MSGRPHFFRARINEVLTKPSTKILNALWLIAASQLPAQPVPEYVGPRDSSGASLANAFAGPNRFIEIEVNGGAPILPPFTANRTRVIRCNIATT